LRRRLPHTNPYQGHKNIRPDREIGLTGRSTMEETFKSEKERAYQGEEDQIPTWNRVFHGGEPKSPQGRGLQGRENQLEKLFRRERVSGLF
jgi:hypothetical protein